MRQGIKPRKQSTEEFMAAPKIRWKKGTVDWFDDEKGQGFLRDTEGEWYRVHYSAIESSKKWKTLKAKTEVEFQVIDEANDPLVKKVREI
jgi:cold shock CspA family protein